MAQLRMKISDELDQQIRAKIRKIKGREIKHGDLKEVISEILMKWVME